MGAASQTTGEEDPLLMQIKMERQLIVRKMDRQTRSSKKVVATFWQIWRSMLFICFISASAFAANANDIDNPSSFSFLRYNRKASGANNLKNPSSFSFLLKNRKALVATTTTKIFNVDSYGAKGDGVTDDQKAFLTTWAAACNDATSPKALVVPAGKTYLVSPITFTGPCNGKLYFQIDGTVIAPSEISAYEGQGKQFWILFEHLQDFVLQGNGSINGNAHQSWPCKNTEQCASALTGLTFNNASNVELRNLRVMNSPQLHVLLVGSSKIMVRGLKVQASETSPNTHGIHISGSNNVTVDACVIDTGDGCVSMNQMSSNINIMNLVCGARHGISIGHLGKDNLEDEVTEALGNGDMLHNTSDGVRIKTRQGGRELASRVVFQNVETTNVQDPIIIDQFYCDRRKLKASHNHTMNLVIVDHFHCDREKIKDCHNHPPMMPSARDAISLKCSNSTSCSNSVFDNVNLTYASADDAASAADVSSSAKRDAQKNAKSVCNNADVSTIVLVVPSLSSSTFMMINA